MGAEVRATVHVHHGAARCLRSLYDRAAEGFGLWSDFDAERWGMDSRITCDELAAMVDGSTREFPVADHRRLHRNDGDFARWGRHGGLRTLTLYGRPYFSLLARFRWGRVEVEARVSHRASLR